MTFVTVDPQEVQAWVVPMLLRPLPEGAYEQLAAYVRLLFRWNQRMNLTAVRNPRIFIELHLGECLRAAQSIPADVFSVLDFGSGAGLPGIPIQIARPELAVTLAESQTKKASYLREAARELALTREAVYSGRVEDLPPGQTFDLVTMRAVDRMEKALEAAKARIGRHCLVLTSESEAQAVKGGLLGLTWQTHPVPNTVQRIILLGSK